MTVVLGVAVSVSVSFLLLLSLLRVATSPALLHLLAPRPSDPHTRRVPRLSHPCLTPRLRAAVRAALAALSHPEKLKSGPPPEIVGVPGAGGAGARREKEEREDVVWTEADCVVCMGTVGGCG
eukprot:CAMPEP_0174900630 /NCGR_PEP_ID=MMETSP0167-20121228/32027_1 /TAXON_ID=38298 /ORGANISM="Rhodella maculata, Strain CCMP736" /LENGTH=122 /DNA_ID=CAMNT_0016142079 /DNA_START=310 /DNA_END=674 /DNA_ORIENTATION=+